MKKVLLSEEIHPDGRKILEEKGIEIITAPDVKEETLISMVRDVEAIIVRSKAKITKGIIENAPKLKIISRTGAGVDNIDVNAATEKGILVCNLPAVNSLSVAEHTIAMILHLAKQLSLMDQAVRNGNWEMRNSNISVEVEGKTLGIVGMGNIGILVAKKCHDGLGMKIVAYDPYVKEKFKDYDYRFVDSLEELFKESDFVTLHCPDIPETRGMITRELIYSMKPTAYLINVARGTVIDEQALIEALKEKRIAGAGLDVFQQEPPSRDNELLRLENVILSPHSAALTKEATVRMAVEAVQAVIDYFEGRQPKYIYNYKMLKEKGYI
ncbi:D-isomer specific 2-hydroxyacid dehydrogenase NAD-binding protein [Thermoanaerobacter italicus Ab9]|uniref:D-isomer specific 2-hydroxyacid dehydrogenase NAD-binding protein n=1 Tax=Thermoanaerobacter italicus (strain DSM 9252 / Ab9) TaxID=580331 RepID=D3T3M5_THEIA|nr:hydroxyacid dehydrogenase [Thermoanaerobacter italicus]ADD02827.1 D-isomer specific 2-hydroxyacid dehydrogenase NAD-binding protein [Thermoanaerobacter italicus Ab9]